MPFILKEKHLYPGYVHFRSPPCKLFFLAVVTIATGSPAAPARDHWKLDKLNMLSTLFIVSHLLNIYFSILPEWPVNTTADVRVALHFLNKKPDPGIVAVCLNNSLETCRVFVIDTSGKNVRSSIQQCKLANL